MEYLYYLIVAVSSAIGGYYIARAKGFHDQRKLDARLTRLEKKADRLQEEWRLRR